MESIKNQNLLVNQAAIWWLGQAGYVARTGNLTLAIDPYLSDSAAQGAPEFSRLYSPPILPEDLDVDIYIITHDHLDHLDPSTISKYQNKDSTLFIAPRLTAKRLPNLGISNRQIIVLDVGETWSNGQIRITGVFALPTGIDVLDTTGYFVEFSNGRNFYHTSDTQYHPLVLAAAPKSPEVMLVPINGKWGNLGAEQAAEFAGVLQPKYVMPNHYDMMTLNTENPEVFKWFCQHNNLGEQCIIPEIMVPFIW
ncbi:MULTISPECIES: MBL fold metallo-hydrolase [unclassified Sphingobacterium]|uniref:MBL fold metallo-hydrolase n=1 Tax=unclassified Sphingobacterium TaxID=2609468 RepID=UPI0020C4B916|nr:MULTISPECIES: MBL fold metallo-hydrolase [unclassified Sphingobacterium]